MVGAGQNRGFFHPASWLTTFWRRLLNTTRTLFSRGDFTTLVITVLLMLIPVLSLNASLDISKQITRDAATNWPISLSQLIPVSILSVLFGFLLSRSHYSELMALILSGIYATATIGVIQFFTAPGSPPERVYNILTRFIDAWNMTSGTGIDPFLLILFLSILIWFLGHNSAWHTFRLDRVWRAILPPGIVLVLNNFYNQDQVNLDGYLIVYLFLAMLLIVRSHIEAREFDWYMNRVAFPRGMRTWFLRAGAIIGLIVVLIAWMLPTGSAEDNAKRFQAFLNGDMITKVTQVLNRLFGSLEGQGVATVDYYGGDKLTLGGAIQLGDQVVMVVKAPPGARYYWKSRVFDDYDGNSWTSSRGLQLTADKPGLSLVYPPVDPSTRQDVTQRFTMVIGASRLVYGAPEPVTIGVPAEVDTDYVDPAAHTVNPSVIHPLTPLGEGDQYSIVSSVSVATAAFLRTSSPIYPEWVKSLDLQLPNTVTARTRALATQIINQAHAQTNYDKAKAIETWLRTNIKYNETLPNPPQSGDLVDWVLFTQKEGYCTYYASAMIVMLRMMGIPARMGAGFAQGQYDSQNQDFIVRERDAHTWVEVYFNGAGWVQFEPTSAQETLNRPDANAPQPTKTVTPTPSPSPTPSPTATQSGAQQPPNIPPTDLPQATFTMTPTSTPTLTPTPTEPPPPSFIALPPQVSDLAGLLLIVAGIIAALSFAAVSVLWYVEYRGLDKLSPVGRAYARLAIYARWLGIPLNTTSTPLERGRRIAREIPTGNEPVTAITDLYIHERYARPHNVTPDEEKDAQAAWRMARRAFIGRKIRRWLRRE